MRLSLPPECMHLRINMHSPVRHWAIIVWASGSKCSKLTDFWKRLRVDLLYEEID
jgi:hypothetical protein